MENMLLLIVGGFFLIALFASMRPGVRPPQVVYVPVERFDDGAGGGGWILLFMLGVVLAIIVGSMQGPGL